MFFIGLFFIFFLYSLAPVSVVEQVFVPSPALDVQKDKNFQDFFFKIWDQESFYQDSVCYFLESIDQVDYENRVKAWLNFFELPVDFEKALTRQWYLGDEVDSVQQSLAFWKMVYKKQPKFEMDEILIKKIDVVARQSMRLVNKTYQVCVEDLLDAHDKAECERRILKWCRWCNLEACQLETLITKKHLFLEGTAFKLRGEWEKFTSVPKYITPEHIRAIETLIMSGFLRNLTLRKDRLKAVFSQRKYPLTPPNYPEMPPEGIVRSSCRVDIQKYLKSKGWLLVTDDGGLLWNKEALCCMTATQRKSLEELFRDTRFKNFPQQLFSGSIFRYLRKLAAIEPSESSRGSQRIRFVSDFENYVTDVYEKDEMAFLRMCHKPNRFFRGTSFNFERYKEHVHHLRARLMCLERLLIPLSHPVMDHRKKRHEVLAFWNGCLKEQVMVGPEDRINCLLSQLRRTFCWDYLEDVEQMGSVIMERFYTCTIERIVGKVSWPLVADLRGEVSLAKLLHNVFGLCEVDQTLEAQLHDLMEESIRGPIIENFIDVFTPFHLGQYLLEMISDLPFRELVTGLRNAPHVEGLFMDDSCSSFRINVFLSLLGGRFISFGPRTMFVRRILDYCLRDSHYHRVFPILKELSEDEQLEFLREQIMAGKASVLVAIIKVSQLEDVVACKECLIRLLEWMLPTRWYSIFCDKIFSDYGIDLLAKISAIWGDERCKRMYYYSQANLEDKMQRLNRKDTVILSWYVRVLGLSRVQLYFDTIPEMTRQEILREAFENHDSTKIEWLFRLMTKKVCRKFIENDYKNYLQNCFKEECRVVCSPMVVEELLSCFPMESPAKLDYLSQLLQTESNFTLYRCKSFKILVENLSDEELFTILIKTLLAHKDQGFGILVDTIGYDRFLNLEIGTGGLNMVNEIPDERLEQELMMSLCRENIYGFKFLIRLMGKSRFEKVIKRYQIQYLSIGLTGSDTLFEYFLVRERLVDVDRERFENIIRICLGHGSQGLVRLKLYVASLESQGKFNFNPQDRRVLLAIFYDYFSEESLIIPYVQYLVPKFNLILTEEFIWLACMNQLSDMLGMLFLEMQDFVVFSYQDCERLLLNLTQAGNLSMLRYFFEHYPERIPLTNDLGKAILYKACTYGHLDIIRWCVAKKIAQDCDIVDYAPFMRFVCHRALVGSCENRILPHNSADIIEYFVVELGVCVDHLTLAFLNLCERRSVCGQFA